jgi:hypothetical protein
MRLMFTPVSPLLIGGAPGRLLDVELAIDVRPSSRPA